MLDFTADQKNDDLAKRFTETFRRQTEKKAAKALFLGVSPLALAACGGGGDSSTAQTLVPGTDGDDTFPNSAANERFEGGLGDDFYTFDLSGTDVISDAGGNDTLRIVWRNKNDVEQIENAYSVGDDLVIEMSGAANVLTVEGAFADATRLENVNYYHADGRWGENATHRIFKLTDEIGSSEIDHMIVGTQTADIIDIQNTSLGGETIWGAGGDDRITTASEIQYIRGGDGNDTISSGAGNDLVWGGDGDDTVDGGDGNDFVWGDAGDDILDGGAGDDQVSGGDGNDTIYMSPGADIEDGGDGIDTIILGDWAGAYSGTLNLETGGNFPEGDIDSQNHKVLNFENVTTQVTGNMTIVGTDGDNIIKTGAGDDFIYAGDGDDTIDAGAGDDTIVSSRGIDFEDGGEGNDTLMFFTSNGATSVTIDLNIQGGGVNGGELFAGLFASIENLKVGYHWQTGEYVGDEGIWTLIGNSENNRLETSEGDDFLEGGSGSDTLTGNGGSDTFVFKQGETGTDTITDFDLAEGDKLVLSSYGITTEEAAEALMSDSSDGVNVTIDGSVIVTMTGTTVADFNAADGWLA
jgi:Ca2+-binding RTX toxin-like protein